MLGFFQGVVSSEIICLRCWSPFRQGCFVYTRGFTPLLFPTHSDKDFDARAERAAANQYSDFGCAAQPISSQIWATRNPPDNSGVNHPPPPPLRYTTFLVIPPINK